MKQSLRNNFFIICVGVILYFFFLDRVESFYFLSFIGGIMVYFSCFWFMLNSRNILDHFFPILEKKIPKKEWKMEKNRIESRRREKLNSLFYYLLGGGFLFILFESKRIAKLFEESRFVYLSASIALFLGVLFFLYFKRNHNYYFHESDTRFKIIISPILFFFLFLPTGNFINHQFPQAEIMIKEYKVIGKKRINNKGGDRKYIFIKTEKGSKKFSTKDSIWENVYEGKTVVFHTQIGFFNFEFVKEIKLK